MLIKCVGIKHSGCVTKSSYCAVLLKLATVLLQPVCHAQRSNSAIANLHGINN